MSPVCSAMIDRLPFGAAIRVRAQERHQLDPRSGRTCSSNESTDTDGRVVAVDAQLGPAGHVFGGLVTPATLPRRAALAGAMANNRWLRLLFVASPALLLLGFLALMAGAPWLFVVATAGAVVMDGLLRLTSISQRRLLRVVYERAAQVSSVRIALMGVAMLLADIPAAALVIGIGLVASVLCRIVAGWLDEYVSRTGWDSAVGGGGWRRQASIAQQYNQGLTITEIALILALVAALTNVATTWVVLIAAAAWLPSLWLVVKAAWQWAGIRREGDRVITGELASGRVAVFFAEPSSRAYQLEQWIPALVDVHRALGVLLVFRDRGSFERFGELTVLPRFYARTLGDLADLYAAGDHAVMLYVNNGWRNFQSLAWPESLHVHINHGESDKTSLVTHQYRAYDRVLVAGPAAINRMTSGLLEVDKSSVIVVGRPQLDYVTRGDVAGGDRRVIVYAPTWEGENAANNFSSVDIGGIGIIQALLEVPDATVLYRPHPRTPLSPDHHIRRAHRTICRLLDAATRLEPDAGHGIWTGDVLALLARTDVLVADVSAVAVDHLYLRPDAQLILVDRARDGGEVRATEIPIARAATVIRADHVSGLSATVAHLLKADDHMESRLAVRREYFSDFEVGESTRTFQTVVSELVAQRDRIMRAGKVAARGSAEFLHESG